MNRRFLSFVTAAGFGALLLTPCPALAQTAPSLGTAGSFAVLGGSTVTNTGPSVITGDLGVSPGSAVTGFPPGIVTGTIHAANAVVLQAQNDTTTAYNALAGQSCPGGNNLTGQDLGGLTLTPGVYCFDTSAQLTGTLTLNAQGNAAAVFIFQTGSTLTTASSSSVSMINGGLNCNVFWQVGSSATLGTSTSFVGNIVALTSITLTTGADVLGRALARNGAVTLDTNDVSNAACATTPVPTLAGWAMIALTGLLGLAGITAIRKRNGVGPIA
jgi:MYXO-CTERM domain-containing protein